jgi:hypothetical protein
LWLFAALPTDERSELRPDSLFTGILIEEVRRVFRLEEIVPITGWWHREIQLFSPQ